MEKIHRFSHRLFYPSAATADTAFPFFRSSFTAIRFFSSFSSSAAFICRDTSHRLLRCPSSFLELPGRRRFCSLEDGGRKGEHSGSFTTTRRRTRDVSALRAAGWISGFGAKKRNLPEIVKAGDPVLHEPARELSANDVGSESIQKIIDDMIAVMRMAPGVGLAAPQIGIPLKIIVLEDTKEYISYAPKNETEAQGRRPFDLLVILNPKLKKRSNRTALFFEGCLSVDGYRAVVERYLEVEVSGWDRHGTPIKMEVTGWQARILQHECDHLDGTLYVDKMVPKTFRIVENLDLPLATGCPHLGAR